VSRSKPLISLFVVSLLLAGPAPAAAQLWTTASPAVPDLAKSKLRDVKSYGERIRTFAITKDNEWVIVTNNRRYYSAGFPESIEEDIERYVSDDREIDVVAFSHARDSWVIIAGDYLRRKDIPPAAAQRIRETQNKGRRVVSFSFHMSNPSLWALVDSDGNVYDGGSLPRGLRETIEAARIGRRKVHEITFAPGGWALVAGDWFVTSGAPSQLVSNLERYRTKEKRRIDHVVFNRAGSNTGWTIISNTPEPAPADEIARLERSLYMDRSIYSRMNRYEITGLAVAYVADNSIRWARGYGLRDAKNPQSFVLSSTIFDAASVSKPVVAVGALQLVDDGTMTLWEADVAGDVAEIFGSQSRAAAYVDNVWPSEFNLNQLLSHCANLALRYGSSGVQRLTSGTLPGIDKVILGESPASADYRVVRDTLQPGKRSVYSGANYTLLTALIGQKANGFDSHMGRLLADLDMKSSTFVTPIPKGRRGRYAQGHRDGEPTAISAYPAQAAASLTSTVVDLAHFVQMLNARGSYRGRRILEMATVDQFLRRNSTENMRCRSRGSMGLGMRVSNPGKSNEVFRHRGTHNGYRSYIFGIPRQQQRGVVILMTGSAKGGENSDVTRFAKELADAFEATYGLPNLKVN
jgi:CubicO group peptidase (beta-lactamase class C family)